MGPPGSRPTNLMRPRKHGKMSLTCSKNQGTSPSGWGVTDVHARLRTRAGKWAAKVPSILRSLRTTPNRSTNLTPFLWCTVQMPCCPPNCSMGPLGSRPTNLMRPSKRGMTPLTCLKNQGMSPSQGRQGTSKHSDITTPGGFTPGPSR
jgi:hypothetical protein